MTVCGWLKKAKPKAIRATVELTYKHNLQVDMTRYWAKVPIETDDGKSKGYTIGPNVYIWYLLRDTCHHCLDKGVPEDAIWYKGGLLVERLDQWDRDHKKIGKDYETDWRNPPWKSKGRPK